MNPISINHPEKKSPKPQSMNFIRSLRSIVISERSYDKPALPLQRPGCASCLENAYFVG